MRGQVICLREFLHFRQGQQGQAGTRLACLRNREAASAGQLERVRGVSERIGALDHGQTCWLIVAPPFVSAAEEYTFQLLG